MKKLSKFIYFIFAFALIACLSIFNPAIDFASADEGEASVNNSLSISNSKIETSLEAGEDLIVPVPKVSDETLSKYIVVTDRSGFVYTYDCTTQKTIDTNGDEVLDKDGNPVKYFTLLNAAGEEITESSADKTVASVKVTPQGKGTYKVQYKVKDGNKTFCSNVKLVQVKSVAHAWEFEAEETAKNIIPSITSANKSYTLPLPTIVNNQDETKSIKYTTADLGTYIKVTNSGVDVTADVVKVVGEGDNAKLVFTPTLNGVTKDTYIVRYVSQIVAFADKTFTVEVDSSYETKAELEVTHNAITNYQVGSVTTFPTANVTDKTHNKSSVAVNTKIVIKKNGELLPEDKQPKVNQYTYTFTEAATYTIQYEVTDAYGNTATSKTTSISPRDRKPYMVTYADSYVTTGEDWEENVNTDVAHTIPGEVGYNGFWLPAIYARDYVDGYSTLAENFTRKLVSTADSSIYFNLDKDGEHGNGAYASNQEKGLSYNDRIFFQFPESADKTAADYAGMEFKLVYTAKDSNSSNTEATATEYIIKISKDEALANNVDKNLIINLPTINGTINPKAEFIFTSATAKEEPKDNTLVADERIDVKTYYYYGAKTEIETLLSDYIAELSANDDEYIEKYGYIFENFKTRVDATLSLTELKSTDGKTTLSLTDYVNQEKVTIFAVAINDQNQFVIKAREVAIDNINDIDIPEVIINSDTINDQLNQIGSGITAFNQRYDVFLPSVSFTDATDKSLRVDIKCYVDTPDQTVGITIDEFINEVTGECGIGVAKLKTTAAGTYYVVYTATDDAGNQASYISTFEVAYTPLASISVENGEKLSAIVNDDVTLNFSLEGEGEYTDVKFDVTWGEKKPSGFVPSNTYTFNTEGTYIATINVTYKLNGQEIKDTLPSTVTITVTKPELVWADDVDELLAERTANINEDIILPIITATENEQQITAVPTIKYYDDISDINDADKGVVVVAQPDHATFNNYYFKAEKNGIYKVTYTIDTEYNGDAKELIITCGDYYDPTINIASNKLQDSKVNYNGKDITVNVTFTQEEDENYDKITGKYILTVVGSDADKELFNYDIKVDLKDTDASEVTDYFTPSSWSFELTGDSVTSKGSNKWIITGVGDYELKLTVKDANGRAETQSISFKVANKTQPKSIKDDVVGIVLIVVSVVLLGGVILFFALAGKRNKSRRISARTNKD